MIQFNIFDTLNKIFYNGICITHTLKNKPLVVQSH